MLVFNITFLIGTFYINILKCYYPTCISSNFNNFGSYNLCEIYYKSDINTIINIVKWIKCFIQQLFFINFLPDKGALHQPKLVAQQVQHIQSVVIDGQFSYTCNLTAFYVWLAYLSYNFRVSATIDKHSSNTNAI